jgi:hypothetical protein
MHKAEQLYDTLRQGDFIETSELQFLRLHFQLVANTCDQLGPRFRLPANEAHLRINQIDGYLTNRAHKP